ncbi:MAG: thioredoxin domain-containing protein [Planctomycetota bacterium]
MLSKLQNATSAFVRAAAEHAIDWHPWGAEAFAKARELNRPVLLDIGASWCHWCHVMDSECYKNEEVARAISERYVAVRVDVDERPDVDARYQKAVLQITGVSGWPLTAFLTSAGDVYYGGTYFSLRAQGSQPGFLQILTWASELYKSGPEKRAAEGLRLRETLSARSGPRAAPNLNFTETLSAFGSSLLDSADRRFGGFVASAKFLYPHALGFLLESSKDHNNTFARDFVGFTLDRMLAGGVYDRLGGGFHRYALDDHFEIPHFEKLLAPNAEMLSILARAGAALESKCLIDAAAQTAEYLIQTLQLPGGGFAASQDAGAEGRGGEYYLWTKDEIHNSAGADLAPWADYYFQLDNTGNFSERAGAHVLCQKAPVEMAAKRFRADAATAEANYQKILELLRNAKKTRAAPAVDTAFIPAWNALAANALIEAARLADRPEWIAPAERAINRIINEHGNEYINSNEVVVRRGGATALLIDTISFAESCISLFEARGEAPWIERAELFITKTVLTFWDSKRRAFFDQSTGSAVAPGGDWKYYPFDDSPHASGNAIALRCISRFLLYSNNSQFAEIVTELSGTAAVQLQQLEPLNACAAARALRSASGGGLKVIISGGDAASRAVFTKAAAKFGTPAVEVHDAAATTVAIRELIESAPSATGTVALICRSNACEHPVFDVNDFLERLSTS